MTKCVCGMAFYQRCVISDSCFDCPLPKCKHEYYDEHVANGGEEVGFGWLVDLVIDLQDHDPEAYNVRYLTKLLHYHPRIVNHAMNAAYERRKAACRRRYSAPNAADQPSGTTSLFSGLPLACQGGTEPGTVAGPTTPAPVAVGPTPRRRPAMSASGTTGNSPSPDTRQAPVTLTANRA